VVLRVGADRVPGRRHLAGRGGMGVRHLTDHQERRLDAEPVERLQDRIGPARHRAVVEGQHDLFRAETDVGRAGDTNRPAGEGSAPGRLVGPQHRHLRTGLRFRLPARREGEGGAVRLRSLPRRIGAAGERKRDESEGQETHEATGCNQNCPPL
jgi:hypothetical protein